MATGATVGQDGGGKGARGQGDKGGKGGKDGKPDGKDEKSPKPRPTETQDDTVPTANDQDKDGALPNTGSPMRTVIGIALALLAVGALTLAGLQMKKRKV